MKTILGTTDWARLQELFEAAINLESSQRVDYLEEACRDAPELRSRVVSLIAAFEQETSVGAVVDGAACSSMEASLPTVGGTLGNYRISSIIGRGGMGIVYRAFRADDEYKKEVAIKVATMGLLAPDLRQRFLAERQILANLDHPNIARLLDGGTTPEGIPFVVMELVEGKPIDGYCDSAQLTRRQRIELMIVVIRSVDYAHRHLVVHRDLKPENVHVTSDGVPKLLDFGIAKALNPEVSGIGTSATVDAARLMTPEYASPEQVLGKAITTATDVYQLGILLYFLLTGRRPYDGPGKTLGQLEKTICETPPARPGLDSDIDKILLQTLEKDPARRYSSAEALAEDLERYLRGFPVHASNASFVYRAKKFVGRHKFGVATVGLVLLLVLGSSIGMAILARRASQQALLANQTTDFLISLFDANDPTQGRGDKITARELLDKGAAQLNASPNQDPVILVRLLDSMGTIYNALGASEKAKEMLEKSLHLRIAYLPKDDVAESDTLARLADVETDLSHYEKAIQLDQSALAAYRRRFGDRFGGSDERIAILLARISSDYWELDKMPQAEAYEREALALSTRLVGRHDPRTLEMIGDLGTIIDLEGRSLEAEPDYDEYLAGEQALKPQNLPALGLGWNYKGWLDYRLGRFAQSEQEMRNALALRLRAYGEKHPVTAGAQSSLAYILLDRGKTQEALKLASAAKDIDSKIYGQDHRETTFVEDSLGLALLDAGRTADARKEFEAALNTRLVLLPPNHMQTGKTWMFLAMADFAAGNLPQAADESRKSIEIMQRIYGPHGHPQLAEFDAVLLEILDAQGILKEAEEFGNQSVAKFRQILPPANPRLAAVESGLARALFRDHKAEQAIPLLREALAIDRQTYGPAMVQTARVGVQLAASLQATGREQEARELVRQYGGVLLASANGTYRAERAWLNGREATAKPDRQRSPARPGAHSAL